MGAGSHPKDKNIIGTKWLFKNKMNEDPETAFYDGVRGMGVADFGLPPIRTMGVRLNVSF